MRLTITDEEYADRQHGLIWLEDEDGNEYVAGTVSSERTVDPKGVIGFGNPWLSEPDVKSEVQDGETVRDACLRLVRSLGHEIVETK